MNVEIVNSKDEKTWKELFDSYYGALCNHCFRIVSEKMTVEDIVQDVFVKLWESNVSFANEQALSAYLYKAVTNNALKYLRDMNAEQEKLREWQETEQNMTEDDFSSVVREEVLRKLRELIDLLPEDRRKIILMGMEGMKGEEIAEKLGISINTVKQQEYRAYKFIKERLGDCWTVAAYFSCNFFHFAVILFSIFGFIGCNEN